MLLAFVLLLPTLVAKTSLRDALINTAIANEGLAVTTGNASFGYLTPLSIHAFELRDNTGVVHLNVDQIETEKSCLILLFSRRDLGRFRFDSPNVEVITGIARQSPFDGAQTSNKSVENSDSVKLDDASKAASEKGSDLSSAAKASGAASNVSEPVSTSPSERGLPMLVAEITDAAVRVRHFASDKPAVDLRGVDFTVRIVDRKSGSNIVVDPTTVLDNAKLTPELCNQGLQLVAPTMSNIVDVKGRISFRLDRCIVPVGQMEESERRETMEIAGAIAFADVTVGLKSRIMEALLPLLARLGNPKPPSVMTISESSAVEFRVVNGRIEHKGLVMQMPLAGSALKIESSGSVGVDETVDVQLAISIPEGILGDSALMKFFQVESVQIQVNGTLDNPQLTLDSTGGWADRLQTLLKQRASEKAATASDGTDATQDNPENIADSILGIVDGLLEKSASDEQQDVPMLRERIRSRRDESQGPRRLFPRVNRRNSAEQPEPISSSEKEPSEI